MEGKKGKKSGAPEADRATLKLADEQITALVQKFLPAMPHLLSVPTSNPYRREFHFENENTPFDMKEVQPMQYMTLVSNGDRGVGVARGNWFDEIYYNGGSGSGVQMSQSPPDSRSAATTPKDGGARKPATKLSIADYKNLKQSGVRPSPRMAASETPEMRSKVEGVNGYAKGEMAGTPMGRVPSLEGGLGLKMNGLVKPEETKPDVKALKKNERPASALTSLPNGKQPAPSVTNGHKPLSRDLPQTKDTKSTQPTKTTSSPSINPPVKHSLPPRPRSPPRSTLGKLQKRPLDPDHGTLPEKRIKTDNRAPSSQKPEARSISAENKPSPNRSLKAQPPPSRASPQPRKPQPKAETKPAKTDKPQALPPFLSPLAPDLTESIPETNGFADVKKTDTHKKPTLNNSSKPSNVPLSSTSSTKSKPFKKEATPSSPLSSPPLTQYVLPRQVSPGLPDVVEAELARLDEEEKARLQEKSKVGNTVEARHEKARQPGAPGVAQKTVRPKVGHPPKPPKQHLEKTVEKPSLIVKLPYKRRRAKDIARILAFKPGQSADFKRYEAERLGRSVGPVKAAAAESESEEDMPISKLKGNPVSRKRPVESSSSQPSSKRPKTTPEKLDVSKPQQRADTPSFRSPAPNIVAGRNLLHTPKKSEALKSVAMRKVDSNDGLQVRTPQAAFTSTPASAEKPSINGINTNGNGNTSIPPDPLSQPNIERLRTDERTLTLLAQKLKHDMDRLLQSKNKDPTRKAVPSADRKLALATGIQSLVTYMRAFKISDSINAVRGRKVPGPWESMVGLWDFVNRECNEFGVLRALCAVVGAVYIEIVMRILSVEKIPGLDKVSTHERMLLFEKAFTRMVEMEERRDKVWSVIKWIGDEGVLDQFLKGRAFGVLPFTGVDEVRTLVGGVLSEWARDEELVWEREDA